jgi:DNA adenine methylase
MHLGCSPLHDSLMNSPGSLAGPRSTFLAKAPAVSSFIRPLPKISRSPSPEFDRLPSDHPYERAILTVYKGGHNKMLDRRQVRQGPEGNSTAVTPFLRWAGGKRQLAQTLLRFTPPDVQSRTYREPFLGGGSLFFALKPQLAILSDANEHLIRCYEFVRDQPHLVARYLRFHASKTAEDHYYRVRTNYNSGSFSAAQAARFIYLNKACFNGIFRVNNRGQFNVPYGWKEPPSLPSIAMLKAVSNILRPARLVAETFEAALESAASNEFIYLDPPYPPLNGTAYFTHYTMDRFLTKDQEKLAQCVYTLDKLDCLVMISNADTPLIRNLYRRYEITSLSVTRYLSCKAKKHQVRELIITKTVGQRLGNSSSQG